MSLDTPATAPTNDYEEFKGTVKNCLGASDRLVRVAKEATSKIKEALSKQDPEDGVGLFDVKNQELITLLMDANNILSILSSGEPLGQSELNDHLAQLNGVVEKIDAMEEEIKPHYQQIRIGQSTSGKSEMAMHARPDMLGSSDSEEDEQEDEEKCAAKREQQKAINQSKFLVPKVAPVPNEDQEERRAKQIEKARKRAMQSSLIKDLRSQYSDAPHVVTDDPDVTTLEKELRRFEENNYTRIEVTRKDKQLLQRRQNRNTLDSLVKFGDYMAMDTVLEDGLGSKRKKSRGSRRSSGPAKKKSKKSLKKGKH